MAGAASLADAVDEVALATIDEVGATASHGPTLRLERQADAATVATTRLVHATKALFLIGVRQAVLFLVDSLNIFLW